MCVITISHNVKSRPISFILKNMIGSNYEMGDEDREGGGGQFNYLLLSTI